MIFSKIFKAMDTKVFMSFELTAVALKTVMYMFSKLLIDGYIDYMQENCSFIWTFPSKGCSNRGYLFGLRPNFRFEESFYRRFFL